MHIDVATRGAMRPKIPEILDPQVRAKFDGYPPAMRTKLLRLRRLILETAAQYELLDTVKESLKWGEPSYLAKGGSAVRIDYKLAAPDRYAMYFQCQTTLVSTFREIHGEALQFEGNRAIVFRRSAPIAEAPLRHCVSLALRYHRLKGLPLLGA